VAGTSPVRRTGYNFSCADAGMPATMIKKKSKNPRFMRFKLRKNDGEHKGL
jgi:hypothetical protein